MRTWQFDERDSLEAWRKYKKTSAYGKYVLSKSRRVCKVCGLEKEAYEFPPYGSSGASHFVCNKCKSIKTNAYHYFYNLGIKKEQAPSDLVEAVEQYYRLSQEISLRKEGLHA